MYRSKACMDSSSAWQSAYQLTQQEAFLYGDRRHPGLILNRKVSCGLQYMKFADWRTPVRHQIFSWCIPGSDTTFLRAVPLKHWVKHIQVQYVEFSNCISELIRLCGSSNFWMLVDVSNSLHCTVIYLWFCTASREIYHMIHTVQHENYTRQWCIWLFVLECYLYS